MSLGDRVDELAIRGVNAALNEAADAINEHLPDDAKETPLGAVLALRKHETALAKAGAYGAVRILTSFAAGDRDSASLHADRARTHAERRAARRRARAAAISEREERDDAVGGLLAALEDIGEFAIREALPFLLRGLLEGTELAL